MQLVATELPLNTPPNLEAHNLREALGGAGTPGEATSRRLRSRAEGKQK